MATDDSTSTLRIPPRYRSKLSWADCAEALRLHVLGRSLQDIATLFHCHPSTIGDVVRAFGTDTRELARKKLQAEAIQLAEDALAASKKAGQRGDGSVALELLDRLHVAERQRDTRDMSPKVLVVVGNGHADPRALPNFTAVDSTAAPERDVSDAAPLECGVVNHVR